jgi:transcriptional regulator
MNNISLLNEKISLNIKESNKLLLEYTTLNEQIHNRNGDRMTEIEKLLDKKNKEFMGLVKSNKYIT